MKIAQKLSSRKLWAAIVGAIVGIALAFGVDADTITNVAGAATTVISLVAYIISEGMVDAARENSVLTMDGTEFIAEGIEEEEE